MDTQLDSFKFLAASWPDLHTFAAAAERFAAHEPVLAAIRLRGFTESMVELLFKRMGIDLDRESTQYVRLNRLKELVLLDPNLLAKFHAIRKVGNNAAHNRRVSSEQVENLLEDAWSLANWFCRFMRPDRQWLIPPRRNSLGAPQGPTAGSEVPNSPDGESTGPSAAGQVIPFPAERLRRIREDVAKALSQVDPSVRQLRTRITMLEAFSEELTDDQKGCIAALEAFLADSDRHVFLLKGYAGTGKTFLAKGLTEFLEAQGRSFHLAAPTGRAAKVIWEKTGQRARTLHGLIYNYGDLKEYADADQADGSQTFKFYAGVRANQDQANTVYIVDEASMVSDVYSESEFYRSGSGYLLHDFLKYVGFEHSENDRKIIFLGDPAQLPPVGMSSSPALDAGYVCEHFGHNPSEYELKEVVRQKAESGVIRNVMPLRDGVAKGSFGGLAFEYGEDVLRLRPDDLLPMYMEARERFGASAPIVITHSNSEAAEHNRAIRSRLFPGREFVAVGDRLIVTANTMVDGQFLANGETVQVTAVGNTVEPRSVTLKQREGKNGAVKTLEVTLMFRDLQISVTLPDGSEAILETKILDDHLHGKEGSLTAAQQRALYVDFLKRHPDLRVGVGREVLPAALRQDPYFNALRTKFAYAVTCHKAQGGEWSHVFVSCQSHHNPRSADYFRWLYTAMTRTSSKLYLISPPKTRIKPVDPSPLPRQNGPDPVVPAGAAPAAAQASGEALSPLEAFRQGVLAAVRQRLAGTGIEIDDVAHHQFQEAFYLRRGADTARVNLTYNGKFKISRVTPSGESSVSTEFGAILAPLIGQTPARLPQQTTGHGTAVSELPTRPFLKSFHERLLPLLDARRIRVIGLKEQPWSQRYSFARDSETAVVDIFYNGKDCFTKCLPISFSGSLCREVVEVITTEIDA